MAGDGSDRDRGRDADEDQQRRHQETAADPEHAGHEADRRTHRQDEQNIDRKIGDGEVELHARLLLAIAPRCGFGAARGSVFRSSIRRQENPGIARGRGAGAGPVAVLLHNRI